jgi:hypothetical protein
MIEQLSYLESTDRSDATISDCGKYRYALWRRWDDNKEIVKFVMLNPSTADEIDDDATIRRCIGFAKSWGYGGICVANLFAYRSKDRSELKRVNDPIGPENDKWLKQFDSGAGILVAAWGPDGALFDRDKTVKSMLSNLHYLELSKQGHPKHPLYLLGNLTPKRFE